MKTIAVLTALALCTFSMTGCRTAHHAAAGAVDESEHAVEKTSHAVHHGVRKVEKHL
jgi:predicted small secreted protein